MAPDELDEFEDPVEDENESEDDTPELVTAETAKDVELVRELRTTIGSDPNVRPEWLRGFKRILDEVLKRSEAAAEKLS